MSSDDNQKSLCINCEKLEVEINDAVNGYFLESLTKRGRWLLNIITKPIQWYESFSKRLSERFFNFQSKKPPIVFDSRSKKECKYIQKYAEIKTSYYSTVFALIIFVIAIGLSYFIGFYYSNIISSIGGAIMAIIATIALVVVIPKYSLYCRIVLDAEKQILSDLSIEPKQQQTNALLQVKEKTELTTQTKERNHPDIWEIYIALAVFFFTIYPIARDFVDKPSNFHTVLNLSVVWWLIFMFVAVSVSLIFKWVQRKRK